MQAGDVHFLLEAEKKNPIRPSLQVDNDIHRHYKTMPRLMSAEFIDSAMSINLNTIYQKLPSIITWVNRSRQQKQEYTLRVNPLKKKNVRFSLRAVVSEKHKGAKIQNTNERRHHKIFEGVLSKFN